MAAYYDTNISDDELNAALEYTAYAYGTEAGSIS
jgi:hypothetical protein